MKKMIATACAVVASSIALASTVESSNTFGVLKVDTGITNGTVTNQYFISVPWKTVGGTLETINPKELVLPSNLNKDDRLYVYSGGSFKPWIVQVQNENTENETKVWAAGGYSDPQGNSYPNPTDGTVNRGDGIVIETSADAIYLTGQYSEDNTAITLADATDSDNPGYTLLGAKLAQDYNLNTQVTWNGATKGDTILLNGGKTTTYDGTEWSEPDGMGTGAPVLKAGTGAWYIRYGKGETPATVTFVAPSNN